MFVCLTNRIEKRWKRENPPGLKPAQQPNPTRSGPWPTFLFPSPNLAGPATPSSLPGLLQRRGPNGFFPRTGQPVRVACAPACLARPAARSTASRAQRRMRARLLSLASQPHGSAPPRAALRARPLPRLAGELTPPARPIFPGRAASSRDPHRDLHRDPAGHISPRSPGLSFKHPWPSPAPAPSFPWPPNPSAAACLALPRNTSAPL